MKQRKAFSLLQVIKDCYRAMPTWMTAFAKYIPDRVIFGGGFRSCQPSTNAAIVDRNIKSVLIYAREHTAWGRDNIPNNISEGNARRILKELPTITSEELREYAGRFVSDEATARNSYWTTTGETGKNPTDVCLSNESYGHEWAHMLQIWRLGGYVRRRDVKLTLRGYHFGPGEILRRDPIYNEIGVDPFQLTKENFPDTQRRIAQSGISCLHGYPTLVNSYIDMLKAHGMTMKVREVMLGSEGATVEQKKAIAEFFDAKVISWYGLTEKVVLAYDETADGRFKVLTSYGYPWINNPDADGVGEIIGTTFVNRAMPLVNFRTGDFGRVVEDDGCIYIENLQGRSGKDFVWESKETKYPVTAINLPGAVQDRIVFYQIIQREYGKIEVLALPKHEWMEEPQSVAKLLHDEIKARLSRFIINIRIVDSDAAFERSKRGKLRMIVQEIQN